VSLPVAHPWFRAEDAGDGVTRLWEPFVDELLESNVWHLPGRDADLVVDFANGVGPLRPSVDAVAVDAVATGRPVIAVATHGHFDHVGGFAEFDDRRVHRDDLELTRAPYPGLRLRREDYPPDLGELYAYYGHELPDVLVTAVPAADFDVAAWVAPGAEPTVLLSDADVVDLGDRRFRVLHTPGHTAGSACLFEETSGLLFSGDAMYVEAKLSWDDASAMVVSLARLRDLAPEVSRVFPGHGPVFDGSTLASVAGAWLDELSAS
jgi:glyoxylase-like metal-dependent hydrolase (beta-lactamase superfamily II)